MTKTKVLILITCFLFVAIFYATGGFEMMNVAHTHLIFGRFINFLLALILIIFLIPASLRSSGPYHWLLLFAVVFFLIRIPYYIRPMNGEDTVLANVMVNTPVAPLYWLMGQIDGKMYYHVTYHPGFAYELIKLFSPITKVLNIKEMNDLDASCFIRFLFSLYGFCGFLVICVVAIHKYKRSQYLPWVLASLFVLFNSQLACEVTTDLQIDGTSGIIFTALFACLVIINKDKYHSLLFFSMLLIGLGKNEWTLMLLAAWVCTCGMEWAINKKFPYQQRILHLIMGGLVGGNVLSFLFDPVNYTGGWHLLYKMTLEYSFLNEEASHSKKVFIETNDGFNILMSHPDADWLRVSAERLEYVFPLIILIGIFIYIFFNNYRRLSILHIFALLSSVLTFVAFFSSSWGAYIRYFTPSFIFLSALFLASIEDIFTYFHKNTIILLFFIIVVASIRSYSLAINLKKKNIPDYYISNLYIDKPTNAKNCLHPVDITINKSSNINFSINYYGNSLENVSRLPLCTPIK